MLQRRYTKSLLFILMLLTHSISGLYAQNANHSTNEWIKLLGAVNDHKNKGFQELWDYLSNKDSAAGFPLLNEIEKKSTGAGSYFEVRFKALKADFIYHKTSLNNSGTVKDTVQKLYATAMEKAYETDDEYLVAFTSWCYGMQMYAYGEIELATRYCLNAVELRDKLYGKYDLNNYAILGEILFQSRDYKKSKYYTHKAFDNWTDNDSKSAFSKMKWQNTIALCWQKLGNYDSAFIYYRRSMLLADKLNNTTWQGIISGNIGQIFLQQKQYDSAFVYLETDYKNSLANKQYDNAANALQYLSRISLINGNNEIALQQVNEAFALIKITPFANYLQNIYYTASEVYRAINKNDSAYSYAGLYLKLHDSIERVVTMSGISIVKMRLADQVNRQRIRNLLNEKAAETQKRNIIIGTIILVAIIALLIINRNRLKMKHSQELAIEQKRTAENEVMAARDQLRMFTANIIEKAAIIEKLETQVNQKMISDEQYQLISELSNQTILTEADWEQFKTLYEKVYPGFFTNLRKKVADITVAEQRMAALVRLDLTTRQMASMLGISPESVTRTKFRLRQRLKLDQETSVEDFISRI